MGRRTAGQWIKGYREPQNPNERIKRDDDGLNVRERIINQYSRTGFGSIPPDDLRGRFRWWGLYTQRIPYKQGDIEDIEDEYFMMRVRIPAGRLNVAQVRALADISQRYARNTADVTDRQNIQYHWIRVEDVPAIWERLEGVGLNTAQACGDVPRNILGSPLAGIDANELIDITPFVQEIEARHLLDPELSNLPRKYKTSFAGCTDQASQHEINDISFVAVRNGDRVGFDLWVGGGLGPTPRLAQRLGVFVSPDRVIEVWRAVTLFYRDYGYRASRAHTRLKFLMADFGPERVREILEAEYLESPLPDGPAAPPSTLAQRDHVGVFPQKDGRFYIGAAPRAGRTNGEELDRVADLAERFGSGEVRLTARQKLVILGVEEANIEAVVSALEEINLQVRASSLRAATMACTGSEFCKLAVVETKNRAARLVDELERRLPELTDIVRIHVNGCPNSCARVQVADIGLLGAVIRTPGGGRQEAFQVMVGGRLGAEAAIARRLKGVRVPSEQLEDYLEAVLRRFLDTKGEQETFGTWVDRAESEWLEHNPEQLAGVR